MKLILRAVLEAHDALGQIAGKYSLPALNGFRLMRVRKGLSLDVQSYEEQRRALIYRLGTTDTQTNIAQIEPGDQHWRQFTEELEALQGAEVELPDMFLTEADFDVPGGILPALLEPLLPFVQPSAPDAPPALDAKGRARK